MATVRELTEPYGNFLLNPLPASEGVCRICRTFTYEGYETCYPCGHSPGHADAVLPISYSPHREQLHTALSRYKRSTGRPARKFKLDLAAVLWRFLDRHEECLAKSMGLSAFEVVTTVPSSDPERDETHPLHDIVGEIVQPTAGRHERLLRRSAVDVEPREVSLAKFEAVRTLHGEDVLLVDDTWTTGSSIQSAAGVLRKAGAGRIGVVVIGRHVDLTWRENDQRLRALPRSFDWERCALES